MDDLHVATVEGLAPDKPIVMLNLMRFYDESQDGDGSGWDAYVRYSKQANRMIMERGGRILWAGSVKGVSVGPLDAGNWDYCALVYYPAPTAFLDMMQSDEYAVANVDRENGCDAHLIMAVDEAYNSLAPRPGER